MKKIALLILDGLGDRPCNVLHGLTPLQFAYKPNMDRMISEGQGGFMHPVSPGTNTGSDTSHLSLLGYDPRDVYTGRGPFEAMGLGLLMNPGDIAFRANFATVDESGTVIDRRAGRISEGTEALAKAISMEIEGYSFRVRPGVEHRAALVVSGPDLSDKISDSDPHEAGKRVQEIHAIDGSGKKTADLVNRYLKEAGRILNAHVVNLKRKKEGLKPANALLLRGVGKAPLLKPFHEKYGMKGSCIAGIPLIRGIGHLAGLSIVYDERMTGSYDSDYDLKVKKAISVLENEDFVIINFKATDVAGHDGDAFRKVEVIEKVDRAIAPLLSLAKSTVIAITGDHSTPCEMKEHSGDPLPLLVFSDGIRTDFCSYFDERHTIMGSLRLASGDLMQYLLALSGRAEKYGA